MIIDVPTPPAAPVSPAFGSGMRRALAVVLVSALVAAALYGGARAGAKAASPTADVPKAVLEDWAMQDGLPKDLRTLLAEGVRKPIDELGPHGRDLRTRLAQLADEGVAANDPRWFALYVEACLRRREARLAPHLALLRRVVFTKHYDLGGSHYAYTEGQSDAQAERHFVPGATLCMLEMDGPFGRVHTLIDDPAGVIRDPDVSYDGRRVLFAWKKSDRLDDYHLYELTVADGAVRQLTSGLGFADYEPAYLPDGHIVFNSTRCVQTVDCWWTEVANLYTCDGNGRYLRRLSFDQVHTNFPTVTPDGRVIYTRWDYSDRGQIYPQGLFQMYPDGTGQTAVYGNNSWFPTTILHARAVPGTEKIVCIFTGHHTRQQGWLGILDPSKGREENQGAQLIAPVRETEAVHVDKYGQEGNQFQYPYPLAEDAFLVTFKPSGGKRFAIYFMTIDGRRELLASDPAISCNQPLPLAPRPGPTPRARVPDYTGDMGVFYVQDVYEGPGLAGVARGTVKRLRVVMIEYRAAGIGRNGSRGPAGGALSSTPVACDNGAWDVKRVLGSTPVYADGSACFRVPARTPMYFQAIDARGHAVQTMRSWATLQPGEAFACVGCHESKNTAPPVRQATDALRAGPLDLEPFCGPPRGFSFPKEVQPILDRHCIRCHHDRSARLTIGDKAPPAVRETTPAFSLLGEPNLDTGAKRLWSDAYLALVQNGRPNPVVNWLGVQSAPPMLPPYAGGAARSRLVTMLAEGHNGVRLSREEMDKLACWIDLLVPFCGDYTEAAAWTDEEKAMYAHFLAKRRRMEAEERRNIEAWLRARPDAVPERSE